jgi:ABC-type cobalt transport system substrate-binding protein
MIGFTAGVNFALGTAIFGPVIGTILGSITFLGTIDAIRQNDIYKSIVAYTSWLQPMSWPGHAIGLVMFVTNLIGAGIVGYICGIDSWQIHTFHFDRQTGMITTVGGPCSQLVGRAYNVGGFTFYNRDAWLRETPQQRRLALQHEAGHLLSNAIFGVFQATNVLDTDDHNEKFWERIAQSNVDPAFAGRGYPEGVIPVWG